MNPLKNEAEVRSLSNTSAVVQAVKAAQKLAKAKGAAFYVVRNGVLVNLNAQSRRRRVA